MDDSENLKLTKTIAFRLTEPDFLSYKEKFSGSGLTQSEFFRTHVLRNTTSVVALDKRVTLQLAQIGNNLNQIARRLNSDNRAGKIGDHSYRTTLAMLSVIEREISDLWLRVGKC